MVGKSGNNKEIRVIGNIWENLDLEEMVVEIHKRMVPSRTPSTGPSKSDYKKPCKPPNFSTKYCTNISAE